MEFKVGDRVRALGNVACRDLKGKTGTIRIVKDNGAYGIEFDEDIKGHTLNGNCPARMGRYSDAGDDFELVKKGVQKDPTHVVIWDEESRDPHKFCTSKKEADDFIKELTENSEVKKEIIVLVEIKTAREIQVVKNLRSKQYKI